MEVTQFKSRLEEVLNVEPRPYQLRGVRFALRHKYIVLCDSMGLGKSLQAMMTAYLTGLPTLIITPSFLKYTWEAEYKKMFNFDKKVLTCKTKKDIPRDPNEYDIIIVNYEMLSHLEDTFHWADFVICDEFHYCMNPKSQRTDFIDQYLYERAPKYFMGLTGTPVKNRVPEWYQLLRMVCYGPEKLNGILMDQDWSQHDFGMEFSNVTRMKVNGKTIYKFDGHRNVPKLKKLLKGKVLRRESKDVLDLPPIIRKEVVVGREEDEELSEAWKEHQENNTGKGITAKCASALAKVDFTVKYVLELMGEGEGPLIIYSDHRNPVDYIAHELEEKEFKVESIKGGDSLEERQRIVEEFQRGEVDILVATIGAASVGITLTKANNMIFNDLSWVPGDNAQAEARIHRIGQEKRCTVHRIVGSIQDYYIIRSLTEKIKTIREVV